MNISRRDILHTVPRDIDRAINHRNKAKARLAHYPELALWHRVQMRFWARLAIKTTRTGRDYSNKSLHQLMSYPIV